MTVVMEDRRGGVRIVGSGGGGKGGGGSARTPVEQPDSLHNTSFAALLDVIGNGVMAGPAHSADPLCDIYLDGTPIQNADGSLNFRNVQVEVRYGTQDQEHIPGFPAAASVTSVGTEVQPGQPWTQAITNPDLSAVRVTLFWPQLLKAIESGANLGDRVGYRIEYAVDLAVGGGSFTQVLSAAVDGKTVNGYARTHRIDLPTSASGWTVRVRRITPMANSTAIQDTLQVQSYAEVIDGKFRYPMTAMVGIKIDAEQFSSIPTRAYHWRGQVIRVPSNYDPITRTYSGVWDGTFKSAWSNNPAWIYYDILTSRLYGLGDRIDASMIDRYALYQIGAYCDQMVSDGQGGQEPRFACNTYLQSQADALRVLNDLTSVFRGMAYWANGQVVAVADIPSDPVYTFTNANVINGRFEYTGADLSTRRTVALVSWNDPTDFYRAKVEVVNDDDGIRRYGIRKIEVKAFGCTSRGQAQRVGLYHLYTSRMETGGISFSVGLDGVIPQPGDIIKIADRNRAGRHIGGRIRQATTTTVTLDRDHPIKVGDTLTVNLPSGRAQTRTVSLISDRVVTVSPAYSMAPAAEAVWATDAEDLVTQPARVISVREAEGITYEISAVFHHPDKASAIDNGVRLEPLPVSVVPPRSQLAPANVQIASFHKFYQGTTRHMAEITWDKAEHAVAYDVQWRRDNGDWVTVPRTGTRLVEIPDAYAGDYVARVRAVNGLDVPSLWAYSLSTPVAGNIAPPPVVASLTATGIIFGIELSWVFPSTPNIIERTELRYAQVDDFNQAVLLGEFSYPTNRHTLLNLSAGARLWFWARLIDKNGTPGDWYPAAGGVMGQASADAEGYLEYFNGLIGEDQLAQGLIEDIKTEVGTGIAEEVFEEVIGELSGDDEIYSGDTTVFAGTLSVLKSIASGDLALTQRIDAQVSRIDDNYAAIREEEITRATQTESLAQQTALLAAQTAVNEAAVQATTTALASLDGALEATYTLRAEVTSGGQMYAAGMALGVYAQPGQPVQSSFYVLADRFAILNLTNGIATTPFVIQGGQAFINQALIGTAWIQTAHIEDLAVTDAKIANLAVTNAKIANAAITTAKIGDAQITTAKIANAQITNAKIGNAEVDTLKIAGNAVTIHGSAEGGVETGVPAGNSRDINVSVNVPHGAQVTINAYVGMWSTTNAASVLINGATTKSLNIFTNGSGWFGNSSTIVRSVGAGTHTFTLRRVFNAISGSGSLPECAITVLVAMR